MADKKYKGKSLILSLWNGSNAYEPIACLTSNSVSETIDFLESATKCENGKKTVLPNNYAMEHSFEGEMIDTTSVGGSTAKQSWDTLKSRFRAQEKLTWKLHTVTWDPTDTTATDDGFIKEFGYGYISQLDLTAEVEDFITFSGTLKVDGGVLSTDPNP